MKKLAQKKEWLSIKSSKELDRRLDVLREAWGENRSEVIRRCINEMYCRVVDEVSKIQKAGK